MHATVSARPQRRYNDPAYPTKLGVLATPELLACHQPAAWLSTRDLAAVAGALLTAGVSGCSESPPRKQTALAPATGPAAFVAPIFEHGDGRGAVGCVVVAAPVFLSEEEARVVIREELTRCGIACDDTDVEFPQVQIPRRVEEWNFDDPNWLDVRIVETGERTPLRVDFVDAQRRVAVEYVSISDYRDLGGAATPATVQGLEFKETASFVLERVRESSTSMYFAAFYDPVVDADRFHAWAVKKSGDWVSGWEEHERRGEVEAKRLLREQVQDFAQWLKAQGVI